jgi:hypothetical protein
VKEAWAPGSVCDGGTRLVTPAEHAHRSKLVCRDIMPEGGQVSWRPRGPTCSTCGEIVFADMCRCGDGLARHVLLQAELLSTTSQALDAAGCDYFEAPSDETMSRLEWKLHDWIRARRGKEG